MVYIGRGITINGVESFGTSISPTKRFSVIGPGGGVGSLWKYVGGVLCKRGHASATTESLNGCALHANA